MCVCGMGGSTWLDIGRLKSVAGSFVISMEDIVLGRLFSHGDLTATHRRLP